MTTQSSCSSPPPTPERPTSAGRPDRLAPVWGTGAGSSEPVRRRHPRRRPARSSRAVVLCRAIEEPDGCHLGGGGGAEPPNLEVGRVTQNSSRALSPTFRKR